MYSARRRGPEPARTGIGGCDGSSHAGAVLGGRFVPRLLLAQNAGFDACAYLVAADPVEDDQLGDCVLDPVEAVLASQVKLLPHRLEFVTHHLLPRPPAVPPTTSRTVGPHRRGLWRP